MQGKPSRRHQSHNPTRRDVEKENEVEPLQQPEVQDLEENINTRNHEGIVGLLVNAAEA